MKIINIHSRRDGARYVAWASDSRNTPGSESDPHPGASPDEAIGCVLRHLWLEGELESSVQFEFDLQSDTPLVSLEEFQAADKAVRESQGFTYES